jgi:hypothetical protein
MADQSKDKRAATPRGKPISLAQLDFEDVVKALAETRPKKDEKRRPASRSHRTANRPKPA